MNKYKIVETSPGVFKIYKKIWIFWKVYGTNDFWDGWKASKYSRRIDAEDSLKYYIVEDNRATLKKSQLKAHIKKTWEYPPNTIKGKHVNDL